MKDTELLMKFRQTYEDLWNSFINEKKEKRDTKKRFDSTKSKKKMLISREKKRFKKKLSEEEGKVLLHDLESLNFFTDEQEDNKYHYDLLRNNIKDLAGSRK